MIQREYICISLDDFLLYWQPGRTTAEIKIVAASNLEEAKKLIREMYPNIAWSVIPKTIMDAGKVNCSDGTK